MQKQSKKQMNAAAAAHTWLILSRATQAVWELLEADLERSELSSTDFRILEVLMSKGPQPVNVIGPRVWLTAGSVSVAIERLLARGLVGRQECARDRRVRTVSLTRAGERRIRAAFERHVGLLERVMARLTRGQRSELEGMMRAVGRRAEELRESGE